MNKNIKKTLSIATGIIFLIFLALLPQILIHGTVESVNLAVKIKDKATDKNKQPPPLASIEPIEKEDFFHFLPGIKTYFLEAVDQDLTCANCRGKTGQALSQARTPDTIINEAEKYQIGIISSTCSDTTVSCDYSLALAKLAKQNGFATAFVYDGCLEPSALAKIIPFLDAIKIEIDATGENFCQNISQTPLQAAIANIKNVVAAKKHLEIYYELNDNSTGGEKQLNEFLAAVKENVGLEAIIHFAGNNASSSEAVKQARAAALAFDFKYIYTAGIDFPAGETTYCADGSIALQRQDNFLLQDNLTNGKCADGTVIPGVWK
jgi:pyruvate-formate lyase-activating enzyme